MAHKIRKSLYNPFIQFEYYKSIAFKATEEKKEEATPSRTPIDASKLDNEEMALIIKSFHQILKQRRGKDYKPRSKKVCYKCGKMSII
jgi:hypothetical protein